MCLLLSANDFLFSGRLSRVSAEVRPQIISKVPRPCLFFLAVRGVPVGAAPDDGGAAAAGRVRRHGAGGRGRLRGGGALHTHERE